MNRPLLFILGAAASAVALGQARIVFYSTGTGVNQHPFVVFNPAANPGTYVVIDNSNANAITMSGPVTADVPVIKSEREENKIRWATGSATGNYTIPFSTASGVSMPLTVNKTTAGTGAGSLIFSTYNSQSIGTAVTAGWNNDNYRPSDVTHMNDMPTGLVNNSKNAIDRFWIIDAAEGSYAYTAKPAVNISFGFDPVESNLNGGNDPGLYFTNNNLVAQRFNPGLNKWYDVLPYGAQTGPTVVTGVTPAPADFYRSWTLSNTLLPLPVQLLAWDASCDGAAVKLGWTTASEQDNDFFTIERSRNGVEWTAIGTVPGAGNSSYAISYSWTDDGGVTGLAYYRLRQTDFNGTSKVSEVITTNCGKGVHNTEIVNAWDDGSDVNVVVSSTADGLYDVVLMDVQGKIMGIRPLQAIQAGLTTLRISKQGIATGIYVVQLRNSKDQMSRRVHIQ